MKVIIVGGVAGGASAAARLRRLDENAEIILLERGDYISYANCGLPYYIGGIISDKFDLTVQNPEDFQERFRVDVRTRQEAIGIDTKRKQISILDLQKDLTYTETYDHLILAPGAKPILPPMKGIEDPRVFTLRTIPDALHIKSYIEEKKPHTAAIIGGGYIGAEMAENLMKAGIAVTIVELSSHLIGSIDFDMAAELHQYLREEGMQLILGNGVKEFHPKEDTIEVELHEGSFACDMVILAVGVTPDTTFLKDSGITMTARGSILVNPYLQTSIPEIYAVGDAIEIENYVTKQAGFIPLAGPANKQGRIAADNICGRKKPYSGTQGSSILKLFDMTVASTGINEEFAQQAGLDYEKIYVLSVSHASYYPGAVNLSIKLLFQPSDGKLLGAQIVGFDGVDKRIDIFATALRGNLTAFDLTELELAYAPPFSSAKEPANMAGYMIENIITGIIQQYYHTELPALIPREDILLLDVRDEFEFQISHIPNAINIPLEKIRERLQELDPNKPLYVNCQTGLRSYLACRILMQHGFTCYNLAGGYRLYQAVTSEQGICTTPPLHPCGSPI